MNKKCFAVFRFKVYPSEIAAVETKIEFVRHEFKENAVLLFKANGTCVLVPYANVAFAINFSEELE